MGFRDWLDETVDWSGQSIPRWKCIRMLVEDGIMPFILHHGYRFTVNEREFANYLATGFYENRKRSHLESVWKCPMSPALVTGDDEAHFHHVVGRGNWDSFWSHWGVWTDVNPTLSSRGMDRRMDCEALVWAFIDIDNSPQSQTLAEIIAGGEEEDSGVTQPSRPGRQGVDTYILESVEYNGWGGYRK